MTAQNASTITKALQRVIVGFSAIASVSAIALHAAEDLPKPKCERVVLCVWDGMRPDFITPELTPHLWELAQRGTFFANNHSSYPTMTEVNGAVLATGAFPDRNGITANLEYRPVVNRLKPVPITALQTIRLLDISMSGRYLGSPTLAERIQRAGLRTTVAGTKPVALLQDRNPLSEKRNGSVTLFGGSTYPLPLIRTIESAIGQFPEYPDTTIAKEPFTDKPHNDWTTRALTEVLWKQSVAPYTVLWLSDPDFSQHFTMPGSPVARSGISESDANLGLVIAALRKRRLLESTNIFVVSDHGFSTVYRVVDLVDYFTQHGIRAAREFQLPPKAGDVLVNNIAGTTGLHVIGGDAAAIQKIVDVLQAGDFAGPIFTRAGLPGTFQLADLHIDSPAAADVVFSFRWKEGANEHGAPGLIIGDSKYPDYGTHGTLARSDILNTLVAAGPDIRSGFRSELPSGNVDIVPTILHLLKIPPPSGEAACDGRVLVEAFAGSTPSEEKPSTKGMEATRKLPGGTWKQYIQTTTYAGRTYFDVGNAETVQ